MRIARIRIHPLKSGGGLDLQHVTFDSFGLAMDRRWMFVDESGAAVTQRSHPTLARVEVDLPGQRLALDGDFVGLPTASSALETVSIHKRATAAHPCHSVALQDWIGRHLDPTFRLMDTAPSHRRTPTRQPEGAVNRASFVDAYPVSVLSMASLASLSSQPEVERFRVNLLLEGPEAFEEDQGRAIHIGDVTLLPVKPIDRCSMVGIAQPSGARDLAPLTELATTRTAGKSPLFGYYCAHSAGSVGRSVAVGDRFEFGQP